MSVITTQKLERSLTRCLSICIDAYDRRDTADLEICLETKRDLAEIALCQTHINPVDEFESFTGFVFSRFLSCKR
jgi:hypothetical protein